MLPCPKCGGKTIVTDSRDRGIYIKRKRKCLNCGFRPSSYERVFVRCVSPKVDGYRKLYPKDLRSDEKILKCIQNVEKHSLTDIVYWAVSKGGMK